MASVLTQSYLLLGEEPLEKIATKRSSDAGSLVGYGILPLNDPASNGTASKGDEGTGTTFVSCNTSRINKGNAIDTSSDHTEQRIDVGKTSPNVNTTLENNRINGKLINNNVIKPGYNDTNSDRHKNLDCIDRRKDSTSDKGASKAETTDNGCDYRLSREQQVNASGKSDVSTASDIPVQYKWTNIVAILSVHVLAVFGVGYMAVNWSTRTILFSFLTGGLSGFGVTGGAHRLWTHKAYKATTPLQLILLFCYTLAGQNTVYEWVRDHRVHHKYSETDADPHNSNRGFFFSHVGWLLTRKHPDVIEKGNKIDMSDITSDPLLEWHRRYFSWLRFAICYVLPVWIPMYLWNETFTYAFFSNTVRYAMSLNATWSVNSFAHIWGYKPYDRRIKPVENLGVAIFAMGEGWHNYHHAFPWDYRASEMGYRYNFTAYLIDQFAKIGWAYDLKKPSESLVATMAAKYGEVPRRTDHHSIPPAEVEQEESKKSS